MQPASQRNETPKGLDIILTNGRFSTESFYSRIGSSGATRPDGEPHATVVNDTGYEAHSLEWVPR